MLHFMPLGLTHAFQALLQCVSTHVASPRPFSKRLLLSMKSYFTLSDLGSTEQHLVLHLHTKVNSILKNTRFSCTNTPPPFIDEYMKCDKKKRAREPVIELRTQYLTWSIALVMRWYHMRLLGHSRRKPRCLPPVKSTLLLLLFTAPKLGPPSFREWETSVDLNTQPILSKVS
jgi:hypothetical protein